MNLKLYNKIIDYTHKKFKIRLKTMKIFFILLIIIVLLSSCSHKKAPESLTPPDIISYETEKAEKDDTDPAVDTLESSLKLLKKKDKFIQITTVDITFNTPDHTIKESRVKTASFQGLSGSSPSAEITCFYNTDGTETCVKENFSNDTVVYEFPGDVEYSYSESLSEKDFFDKHRPYLALDNELYEKLILKDKSILFEGGNSLESWIALEGYSLVSSQAVLKLDNNGNITLIEYSASAKKLDVTAQIYATIEYK